MTVENIILNFITSQGLPLTTRNWAFEAPIAEYAVKAYNVWHTPGTYARCFRKMREQNIFYAHGLSITDVTMKGDKTKVWLISNRVSAKSPSTSPNAGVSSP